MWKTSREIIEEKSDAEADLQNNDVGEGILPWAILFFFKWEENKYFFPYTYCFIFKSDLLNPNFLEISKKLSKSFEGNRSNDLTEQKKIWYTISNNPTILLWLLWFSLKWIQCSDFVALSIFWNRKDSPAILKFCRP